ncbi:hypothetical protein [Pseudonocardia oroxyli]|uniref:Uncharacterized protein n=1 Tax=Pseudonocardia oroxyli TaxID=366584 RepID=A0A1G8CCW6_PSEOR|nr:hypothetical protein [Pseudonocardia oroxyli]SDH43357.1 hypothetical protein SAMN05216377_12264 [Pseudonocardia oroxyli]
MSLPFTYDHRLTEIGDRLLDSPDFLVDGARPVHAVAAPSEPIADEVAGHLPAAWSVPSRIPRLR